MNKRKWLVVIATAIVLPLAAWMIFRFAVPAIGGSDPLDVLPDTAPLIMRFNDYDAFSKKIAETNFGNDLLASNFCNRLNAKLSALNDLTGKNMQIAKQNFAIACYLTKADDFDFLLSVPVKKLNDRSLKQLIEKCPLKTGDCNQHVFNNAKVYEFNVKNGDKWFVTAIDQCLIASTTAYLTDHAIAKNKKAECLKDDNDFTAIRSNLNAESNAWLFIHYRELGAANNLLLNEETEWLNAIRWAAAWSGFELQFTKNQLYANGFTTLLPEGSLTPLLTGEPASNDFYSVLPENTAFFKSCYLPNTENYLAAFIGEKNPYASGIAQWMKNQYVYVLTESFDASTTDDLLLAVSVKDDVAATQFLNAQSASSDSAGYYSMRDAHHLQQILPERWLSFSDSVYAFKHENWIFFSSDLPNLKAALDKIRAGHTLGNESQFTAFQKQYSSPANIQYFVRTFPFSQILKSAASEQTGNRMKELMKVEQAALYFSKKSDKVYTSVILSFGGAIDTMRQTEQLWTTPLESAISASVAVVQNKINQQYEIFVQDTALNLYKLSSSGSILYTRKLDSKWLGTATHIDVYGNGEFYHILNTEKFVYLLDENGDNAVDYPLRLASTATAGVTCVRYENKDYRYYVPCSDKTIYAYDISGKPAAGWNPKRIAFTSAFKLQHFDVAEKDYLVLSGNEGDKCVMEVYNRKGELRFDRTEAVGWFMQNAAIEMKGQNFFIDNYTGGKLLQIDREGHTYANDLPVQSDSTRFALCSSSPGAYDFFHLQAQNTLFVVNRKSKKIVKQIQFERKPLSLSAQPSVSGATYTIVQTGNQIEVFSATGDVLATVKNMGGDVVLIDLFNKEENILVGKNEDGQVCAYRIP